MLFSVIIPTFNRRDFLHRTLTSVKEQHCKNYEVIVVDDGSTDGTLEMLRAEHPQVRVMTQANAGPGAARNLGVSVSSGDYIAFLDSDDLWFPWTLETFSELVRLHHQPAIMAGQLVGFSDEAKLAEIESESIDAAVFEDYLACSRHGYFVGSGMAVLKRNEFLKTGGFTTQRINAEDHDLILRMGTARGFVQLLKPVTLAWRRHIGSSTMNFMQAFRGGCNLVNQERQGHYPGGSGRKRERREIVTRHVRSTALACLRKGLRHEAWELYLATFRWHLALGRWKFLLAFPLVSIRGSH